MRHVVAAAVLSLLPLNAYAAPGQVPAGAVMVSGTPSGEGDPSAWTCRAPQYVSIWQSGPARRGHMGPVVCQTNQYWAELKKHHRWIDETGAVISLAKPGIGSWGNTGGADFGQSNQEKATFDAHK